MAEVSHPQKKHNPDELICCNQCRSFHFFENNAEHNSPHALGNAGVNPGTAAEASGPCFGTIAMPLRPLKSKSIISDPIAPEWGYYSKRIFRPLY